MITRWIEIYDDTKNVLNDTEYVAIKVIWWKHPKSYSVVTFYTLFCTVNIVKVVRVIREHVAGNAHFPHHQHLSTNFWGNVILQFNNFGGWEMLG